MPTLTGICGHSLCIFCLKHGWGLGLPAARSALPLAVPVVSAACVQTLSAKLHLEALVQRALFCRKRGKLQNVLGLFILEQLPVTKKNLQS